MTTTPPFIKPKTRSKATPWLITVGAVLIGLCCIGGAITVADSYSDAPAMSGGKPIAIGTGGAAKPAATAAKPAAAPKPDDFALTVKILEKKCFGSAGCNVEFRVELAYNGTGELDPATTYEITYEVRGGDDPQISTLTVRGAEFEQDRSQLIQTASSKSVLTAVVTSVSPA